MVTVLVATVGGSCDPVINTCREFKPDFIYFVCSGGKNASAQLVDWDGDVCGDHRKATCIECGVEFYLGNPKGKSIVAQLGLKPDCYEKVIVEDPDDLNAIYQKLGRVDDDIVERFSSAAEVLANYTGGTKTMAVALALKAVLCDRWVLSVSRGPRSDLIKVRSGDIAVRVDKWLLITDYQQARIRDLLDRFEYQAVEELLQELTRAVTYEKAEPLLHARRLCRAFTFWDAFKHKEARDILVNMGSKALSVYLQVLAYLTDDNQTGTGGYVKVQDLIRNAERRALQKRFDDGVARLYRALELLAQQVLQQRYGQLTGDINVAVLPAGIREKYEAMRDSEGKVKLPLVKGYSLLAELNDSVGELFMSRKNEILHVLHRRNNSILAHGLDSLNEGQYNEVSDVLVGVIDEAFRILKPKCPKVPQLPRSELLGL